MRSAIASISLAVLLLVPASASAGGWWSFPRLERATVAPGQVVRVRATEILFESVQAAERARNTPFYAYVLSGLDGSVVRRAMSRADPGSWWTPGDVDLLRVGRVRLTAAAGSNLATARARFRLPDIAAGRYSLMLCAAGCGRPLADVIPADLRVVPDPFTAALAARVEHLESRAARVRGLPARVDRLKARTSRLQARAADLEEAIRGLPAPPAVPRPDTGVPWWSYAGWVLAGAVLGGLGARLLRRRRPGRAASLDDALAQLLAEEGPKTPRARAGR